MADSNSPVEQLNRLLEAGAKHNGRLTVQAAIHLLTFTELPHHRGFDKLIRVTEVPGPGGTPARVAFVRDWKALRDAPTDIYLGDGDQRLLSLAISLATGAPVDLTEVLIDLSDAQARRVIEAIAVATGAADFYTLTATRPLGRTLAARDAHMDPPPPPRSTNSRKVSDMPEPITWQTDTQWYAALNNWGAHISDFGSDPVNRPYPHDQPFWWGICPLLSAEEYDRQGYAATLEQAKAVAEDHLRELAVGPAPYDAAEAAFFSALHATWARDSREAS